LSTVPKELFQPCQTEAIVGDNRLFVESKLRWKVAFSVILDNSIMLFQIRLVHNSFEPTVHFVNKQSTSKSEQIKE
jgi:hypothetical protein